ncbi:PPC domain-containing protein [Aeromonas sp.]|uniref:PPC domain-containing protein n=1 Tax=Aeromonas sp. TaxID=647 RepID=UPI00257C74D9|nr:PPC domain-containing protein [Aeromonas sp.]
MKRTLLVAVCSFGLLGGMASGVVQAADDIKTQQVQFKKGEFGAIIKGTIQGHETLDYTLTANKGQSMAVTLTGKSSTYFNILPPGSTGEAIFIGSSEGNNFQANLPAKGTYTIRVYQNGRCRNQQGQACLQIGGEHQRLSL